MVNSVPRVWVIQEGRNDYSSAEEYGTVHFVTTSDMNKLENSAQNAAVIHDLRKFLSQYIAGTDYIIPSGNPMVVALAMMGLPTTQHNLLKWDGRRAVYVPFKLDATVLR